MSKLLRMIKSILHSKSFDKILAFLLSFFLWLFVVSGKSITDKISLRLDYKIRPDLAFVTSPPKFLKVRYQGPRAYWGKIPDGENIEIDLSNFKRLRKKAQVYKIKRRDLPFVQGLNLVDYDLKKIQFNLDKKVKKSLPIKIKKMGTLNKILTIDRISTNPNKVTLEGASSFFKNITEIPTEWIDLSSLTEGSYQKKVKLNVPSNVTASAEIVDLSIDLRVVDAERLEKIIPIQFISRGESFKPKSLEVKVIYEQSGAGFLGENAVMSAYVKIPEKFSGQKILAPVKIEVPNGLKVIDYTPRRVEIFD